MIKLIIFATFLILQPVSQTWAAMSVVNNHIRIFEDTLWLITFLLMSCFGLLMRFVSAGTMKLGYFILGIAGFAGLFWKGIGLISRVFSLADPVWLFTIIRQLLEALTGFILAVAFLFLSYGLIKLFK
ncbi:MAG: hypothetical protein V9G63_15180 [Candidatus Competibacter sp.]|nr:hypothetical protein [Candidatus Competibacteraceae bacterium]